MNKYIYKANGKAMHEDIKYWCNCCGELHNHGDYTITEDELPQELKGVFKDLWTDKYGSLCCLIETPNDYGIALINEYDPCYANDCRMSMDDLFISLLSDVNMISERDEFMRADIYLGESISVDDCHGLVIHELIVVFPCNISNDEFTKAAVLLDELAYQQLRKCEVQN